MTRTLPTPPHPHRFLVAHRSGNDLRRIDEAVRHDARLIECDLRLYRGRIEVRHLKTIGPIPILWDTWRLANPFAQRLQLHELLKAVESRGIELMLDLKGRQRQLSRLVVDQLATHAADAAVTVCARRWDLLEPFDELPHVRMVCSIGSRRGLRRLLAQHRSRRLGGVSIHADLLDPHTVAELNAAAELVMTWPVNDADRARTLLAWGVNGLITDEAHLIAPVVADSLAAA